MRWFRWKTAGSRTLGRRPGGHHPFGDGARAKRALAPGRLDHHAAACAQHLPQQQPHVRSQDPRGDPVAGPGKQVFQGPDLELYLNKVYFGGGAYGVDLAARKFFGHSGEQLSLGEAAIIAGLVKAPSHYSPTADAQAAVDRAKVVLETMVDAGTLTPAQAARSISRRAPRRRAGPEFRPLFHRLGAAAA
jgi:hypothetical protein